MSTELVCFKDYDFFFMIMSCSLLITTPGEYLLQITIVNRIEVMSKRCFEHDA